MIGLIYVARIPTFSRLLSANDVVIRLSAPSTGALFVHRAWWGQRGTDDLNEPSVIEFVRLSTDGSLGATVVFEPKIPDQPTFAGSAAGMDTGGWTLPTVTGNPLDPLVGNWATGYEWAAHSVSDCQLVPPSARIGLRILDTMSVAMQQEGGIAFGYVGS